MSRIAQRLPSSGFGRRSQPQPPGNPRDLERSSPIICHKPQGPRDTRVKLTASSAPIPPVHPGDHYRKRRWVPASNRSPRAPPLIDLVRSVAFSASCFHPCRSSPTPFLHDPAPTSCISSQYVRACTSVRRGRWRAFGASRRFAVLHSRSVLAVRGGLSCWSFTSHSRRTSDRRLRGVYSPPTGIRLVLPAPEADLPLFRPFPMPAWLFVNTLRRPGAGGLGVTGAQDSVAHFAHLGACWGAPS